MNRISYQDRPPEPEEYLALRRAVGFSPRSMEAVLKGLGNSNWALTAREDGQVVGMARMVGDGGCSFLVVDVIVLPEWQGRGIGSEMMRRLDKWCEANIPPGGMVSMLADKPGRKLYERHWFRYTAPESLGMKKFIPME